MSAERPTAGRPVAEEPASTAAELPAAEASAAELAGQRPDAAPSTPPDDQPRRPRPSPGPASPTSRARRAAAAGVDPTLHRPSPTPQPARPAPQPNPSVVLTKAPDAAPGPEAVEPEPAASAGAGSEVAGPAAGEPTPHRVRARAPRWLAAVLLALIVVLGGLSAWLAGSAQHAGSVSERDQALSAAKTSVPLILSYGYQSFDADLAKAQAQLTGRASADYVQAMTKTIKPAATKAHVVVKAQTDGAGVEAVSADGQQVTVIVFGEQKVTNTSLSAPRTDLFRVRATLNLVGGHWLVSKFDQI